MISKEFVKSGSILVQLIFVHINIIFLNSPWLDRRITQSHNLFFTCLLNTILEEEKKYKNKTPKTILSLGVEVGVVKFLRPNMKMTPTFSTNGYYFIRDLFLALMWKELSTKLFNQSFE